MTEIDLSRAEWRKSSFSSQSGNCVEVAHNLPALVAVRDSKAPEGTELWSRRRPGACSSRVFAPSSFICVGGRPWYYEHEPAQASR
jgi:Domain of unknown function (DUF397)